MTQSKFDLNAQFDSYNFFRLGFACMWVMSKLFVYYMHAQILFSVISSQHTLPHSIHMQSYLTSHLHECNGHTFLSFLLCFLSEFFFCTDFLSIIFYCLFAMIRQIFFIYLFRNTKLLIHIYRLIFSMMLIHCSRYLFFIIYPIHKSS